MPKLSLKRNTSKKSKKPTKKSKKTKLNLKKKLFNFKTLIWLLIVVALAGFGYSGTYWYQNSYTNYDNIFYGMLDNSLSTSSVTRTVTQTENTRSENQSVVVQFSPTPIVHSKNRIEQIAQNRSKSVVATETYGSPTDDFIRYTDVQIPQTTGQPVDYSKILNTWAKQTNQSASGSSATLLNDAAFTFIPFGNFPKDKRAELISSIKDKKIYKVEQQKIRYQNMRPVYSATVGINPRQFVTFMRDYAEQTGLGNLDQLDPSQYSDGHIFSILIEVDVLSRHLKTIKYGGSARVESYDSYGLTHKFDIPKPEDTITADELQSRLQQQ